MGARTGPSKQRVVRLAMCVVTALCVIGSSSPVAALPVAFRATPLAGDRLDGVGLATLQVGTTVYVGGTFGQVRNQAGARVAYRANLAAFDLRTGRLLTAFRADTNGPVRALASDGRRLFVGGSYTTVNGVARSRVSAVDLTTGAVDPAFRANATSNVYALATARDRLVVGGSFSTLGGQARRRVAVVSTTTGAVSPLAPDVNGTVHAVGITSDGRRIIAGGAFTTVNGRAQRWAAVIDGSTGALAPAQLTPVEGPLSAIAVPPGNLTVAASMSGAGNSGNRYRLSDGRRLWRQVCDGDGQAIEEIAGNVYTGFHESCSGDRTIRLTANDAVTGTREAAYRPSFDRFWGVHSIDATTGAMVVAGDFTRIAGVPVQGFAIFRAA